MFFFFNRTAFSIWGGITGHLAEEAKSPKTRWEEEGTGAWTRLHSTLNQRLEETNALTAVSFTAFASLIVLSFLHDVFYAAPFIHPVSFITRTSVH